MSTPPSIPSSIIVVGSGVFGLGTAYALAQRPSFRKTKIILLDRSTFPAPDGASVDSSRIVRADYADPDYAALMAEGQPLWRGELGAEGRYTQSGLAIYNEGIEGDERARYYLEKALENVIKRLGLKRGRREDGGEVEVLEDAEAVTRGMGTTGGNIGPAGYVNWTSGWAHAEEGLKFWRRKCEEIGRVDFRTAEVKRLLFRNGTHVEGVELASGEALHADLTVLAAGAWTPKFIDLRGRASATGQAMAYINITQEEQDRLKKNPVYISESSGMFIIPPCHRVLKVARHGFGYANPTTIEHPEISGETITVSLPLTKQDRPDMEVPLEGRTACREFLRKCIPDLGERPWIHTRICWYTDTPKGDYIVDYHPKYQGLFVATGGSGHAYKFLPVIGDRIVDLIERKERDDLGKELKAKWQWPVERFQEDHVWTDDWRGGPKGMILSDEYAKS